MHRRRAGLQERLRRRRRCRPGWAQAGTRRRRSEGRSNYYYLNLNGRRVVAIACCCCGLGPRPTTEGATADRSGQCGWGGTVLPSPAGSISDGFGTELDPTRGMARTSQCTRTPKGEAPGRCREHPRPAACMRGVQLAPSPRGSPLNTPPTRVTSAFSTCPGALPCHVHVACSNLLSRARG